MRQPKRKASGSQVSRGASLAAPVKGWDAQSPLAAMKPGNAVVLDNWVPRPGYVELRQGYREQTTPFTDEVETLLVWRGGGPGADKLFGVSNGSVYDANTLGGAPGAAVYTGLINSRVQSVNFANDGGVWLIGVNGAATPFKYTGSAWSTTVITGSSGSITLTAANLIDVMAHKRRLFFIEKDTLRVWFLPVNAIAGASQLLDLGPIFEEGGSLAGMGTWSLDGGQGQDDVAVFVTTQGQMAVYQGTDPASASAWALIGVYNIGLPLGRRFLMKYGGDLIALTTGGVIQLSQALSLDRTAENTVALTAKIQNAFATSTTAYGSNFGWQGILYPAGSLAIYNIPTAELETSVQYVQNVQTGAWCQFKDIDAFCWAEANGSMYFGSRTAIYQWDVGVTDNGMDVTADMVTNFSYFGNPGRQKQFTMLRPILRATSNVVPAVEMLMDFNIRTPTAMPTVIDDRSTVLETRYAWTGVAGVGYAGAVAMSVTVGLEDQSGDRLAVGDGSLLVTATGGTDHILIDSNEPVSAQIQAIGFDVVFQPGGQL